jgi:hypothetical protein
MVPSPILIQISRSLEVFVKTTPDLEPCSDVEVRPTQDAPRPSSPARRSFLGKVGATAAATLVNSAASSPVSAQIPAKCDDVIFPMGHEPTYFAKNRFMKSFNCRQDAAKMARERPLVTQINNGDELLYESKIGSYSKALPHNNLGDVDLAAYQTLVDARESIDPSAWERVTLGLGLKLTSPQAGLGMDLQGPDSHHVKLPPAPAFASAEEAGEEVELYWMALARDISFSEYNTSPLIAKACEDLSRLSDFRGPKENGVVTPNTIFRASIQGDLTGYWVSQFLLLDFYFGANFVSQRMRTTVPGVYYMTGWADWLAVQNGADKASTIQHETTPRYIHNLRDMSEWVHVDALYQAYLHACLIMMGQGIRLDPGLPLTDSKTQLPFAQCGGPHILSLVTEVATRALKAVWYQKWFVHHRLRPEEYAGKVHNHITGAANYPLHTDVLNSKAVQEVFSKHGTYLLPMAFPEGCPTHPAYGSGHSTVAGACVTILKAFFDETDTVRNPMVPNADGTALVPFTGPPLTVLDELNKVALNVAFGRNAAGVHWQTDAINSLALGEEVAIGILQEQKLTYHETVEMSLTKFDGTKITI